MKRRLLSSAVQATVPVMLGYLAIGIAFGLLLVKQGYPWWLALVMSLIMYAGAGQYIAVGLFASGAPLAEAVLVQLVVNARHIAYGLSMLKRFNQAGAFKYYLIFALTDETFALLSSLPDQESKAAKERMFFIALLDQGYWVIGTLLGAAAGSFIPFSMEGIGFSLTALFIVLLLEQIRRIRKPALFVVSGLVAIAAVFALPSRVSLLSALALSLALVQFLNFGSQPARMKENPDAK